MASMTATARRTAVPAPSRTGRALLVLVLLGVAVAAVMGTALAIDLIRGRSERAALASLADPATPGLGLSQPIRTSFGAMTVGEATIDNGLSAEDLGGMSHGVSSLVAQGSAEVNVVVTVNNTSRHPVVVQALQFRLLTGRAGHPTGRPTAASVTTLAAGALPPRSVVDARVTFVTPTNGAQMWLEYTDPGSATPIRVSLGTTSRVATAKDGHQH